MILEIADIRIDPARGADFDAALAHGLGSVVSTCPGYRWHRVVKGIESPGRYMLTIGWDTLEAHTDTFRNGPLFPQWRAIVGPFFAQPPQVEHYTLVTESNGAHPL